MNEQGLMFGIRIGSFIVYRYFFQSLLSFLYSLFYNLNLDDNTLVKNYDFLLNVPFSTETLSGVLSQYLLFLLCTEKCILLNRQFLEFVDQYKTSTSY